MSLIYHCSARLCPFHKDLTGRHLDIMTAALLIEILRLGGPIHRRTPKRLHIKTPQRALSLLHGNPKQRPTSDPHPLHLLESIETWPLLPAA